jgi:hypothetical protein
MKKSLKIILIVILGIFTVCFLVVATTSSHGINIALFVIALLSLTATITLAISLAAKPTQIKLHTIESEKQTFSIEHTKPQIVQQAVKRPIVLKLLTGLPIMEGSDCTISANQKEIVISSKGLTFNLENWKITDVSITTNTEIQNAAVSSVGGAIGGAFLFGPVGAMIGGRTKGKKIKKIEHYLVFTYLDENGELKYVAFYATDQVGKARKFVKEFLGNVGLQQRAFKL